MMVFHFLFLILFSNAYQASESSPSYGATAIHSARHSMFMPFMVLIEEEINEDENDSVSQNKKKESRFYREMNLSREKMITPTDPLERSSFVGSKPVNGQRSGLEILLFLHQLKLDF
jgi:hypothetical protein